MAVDPAIQRIHDLLYLEEKDGTAVHKPDKEWNADTIDAIADVVAELIPRPKET